MFHHGPSLQEALHGDVAQRGGPLLPGRLPPAAGPERLLQDRVSTAAGLHVRQRPAPQRAGAQPGGPQLQHMAQRAFLQQLHGGHGAAHGQAPLPALLGPLRLGASGPPAGWHGQPRLPTARRGDVPAPDLRGPPACGQAVWAADWPAIARRPAALRVPLFSRRATDPVPAPVSLGAWGWHGARVE